MARTPPPYANMASAPWAVSPHPEPPEQRTTEQVGPGRVKKHRIFSEVLQISPEDTE